MGLTVTARAWSYEATEDHVAERVERLKRMFAFGTRHKRALRHERG